MSSARIICSARTARSRACSHSGSLGSLIFWGPPGTGKTTVARLLARETDLHFEQISAVFSGVADLKKVFEAARARRADRQGHAALRRRDPPLQPRPAGSLPAGDGGRHRHPGRRDDRKPVLRAERGASVARPRAGLPAARRGGARAAAGAGRSGRGRGRCRSTTMPRAMLIAHGRRRRPRRADARRGGLARRRAGRDLRCRRHCRRSCSAGRRSTTRARTATTI